MKKVLLSVLTTLIALLFPATMSAQLYVIDSATQDSVNVNTITITSDGSETLGLPVVCKLPKGETVKVERLLKGQTAYGVIKIDGKEYGIIGPGVLVFSDENPEGTVDIFGNTRANVNHSAAGKFFVSPVPYWIIAILFVVAMAFAFLGLKIQALRKPALFVVPVAVAIASLMEVWAYWTWGSNAFWWCDSETYGFFGSLLRAIPFVVFVAFQLGSIFLYKELLVGKRLADELSIKAMAISMGISLPVFFISIIALFFAGVNDDTNILISVLLFILTLAIGSFISLRRNTAVLGKFNGTAFTIFGAIYILGAMVAIVGLLIILFKLILQVIIIVAGVIGVGFTMGSKGASGATSYKTVYYDQKGGKHDSEYMARKSNDDMIFKN